MATGARRGQWRLRLTPHADAQDYAGPFSGTPGPGGAASKSENDEPEQEESDAAANDGEGRLGRADRPRRHRGGRLRPLHLDAGPAGRAEGHRRHRAVADAAEGAGDRGGAAPAGRGAHRRRLRRGGDPGAHRARHSADGGRHRQLGERRRACDLHDVCARQEGDVPRRGGARQPLAGPLEGRAGRSRREDHPDRRLRPHRHAHRQALPRDGHDRADLRPVRAGRDHQGGGLRAGRPIWRPRCRAPTSCASIARRRPRR